MTTAPRDLTVTYGTILLGSAVTRQIHDKFSVELSPSSFSFEFQLLVSSTTDALFSTEVAAIESAIRTPFQDLVIVFNSVTQYDFSESTKRGLNTRGTITKSQDVLGTRLARLYTIRFEGDLPADKSFGQPAGITGWREATVQITFDSARRRTVTISGEWTATPSPIRGARTSYENASSGVSAYASSVLTAIDTGSTWRLHDEDYDLDDTDLNNPSDGAVLRFTLTYREVLFQHAGIALAAGVESGAVARQVLRITRDRTDFGSSPGVRRLITATASYDAWIDETVVSGSSVGANTGGGLENLWDNTIREFILDRMRGSGVLAGAVAVLTERPIFEFDENRITATIVAQGGPGVLLERRLTTEESEVGGVAAVPVWDGGVNSRYVFESPVEHRRTIIETARVKSDLQQHVELSALIGQSLLGGRVIEKHSSTTPLVLGTKEGGGTLNVVDLTMRLVILVFNSTDGRRLSEGQTAAAAPRAPFLVDFSESFFEIARGAAVGNAPIDME